MDTEHSQAWQEWERIKSARMKEIAARRDRHKPIEQVDEQAEERARFVDVLTKTRGNAEEAGVLLGMSRAGIYRRAKSLQIDLKNFRKKEGAAEVATTETPTT